MNTKSMKPSFDPFNQEIFITIPGEGRVPLYMNDIGHFVSYAVRICINYSSQIGASFMLLVVLLLLTKAEKRWTSIYTLNVLSLLINTIRNVLQCVYFTGPFYNPYAFFSKDYSRVPNSQYGAQIAATIFTTFLDITIEASLVLQVRTVCATMTRKKRLVLLLVSAAVAITVVGWRSTVCVVNSIAIIRLESMAHYQWLLATSMYVFTSSICFFSLIFVIKLGFAIKQRRKLGLRQLGPMQVIFIMGCQTLLIPVVFAVLEWFTVVPEFGSQVSTMVTVFLPLSSMWAARSVSDNSPASSQRSKSSSTRKLVSISSLGSLFSVAKSKVSKTSTADTLVSPTLNSSSTTNTSTSAGREASLEREDSQVYGTRTVKSCIEYDEEKGISRQWL